ncbi:hypothetical protein AAFF_G00397820 [Aldrovandia affinis]|uniref:Uncharacterized protein n=1 Tax=Aldrovandia affinis TaxID=143900 RepID=A0AAD7SDE5_9TELE|nr:hypothetical protein AAFF_G00397820 [Aldrovandia affinis]
MKPCGGGDHIRVILYGDQVSVSPLRWSPHADAPGKACAFGQRCCHPPKLGGSALMPLARCCPGQRNLPPHWETVLVVEKLRLALCLRLLRHCQ